jgi:hypothetical protein
LPLILLAGILTAGSGGPAPRWRRAATIAGLSLTVILILWLVRWLFIAPPAQDVVAFASPRAWRNIAGLVGRCLSLPRLGTVPLLTAPVFWMTATGVALLIAVALRDPHSRRTIWTAVVTMSAAFLPFIALPGYSDRFAYLASAGFVLVAAAGLQGAGNDHRLRWFAGSIAVVLAVMWCLTLLVVAGQWMRAGQITTRIASEVREVAGAARAPRLRFYCIPDFYGGAPVYLTYFERDIGDALGPGPRSIERRHDGDRVDPAQALKGLGARDLAFRWNQAAWQLERLPPARDIGSGGTICPEVPEVPRP